MCTYVHVCGLFSTRQRLGRSSERSTIGTGAVRREGTAFCATAGTLQLVEQVHCLECSRNSLWRRKTRTLI